MITPTTNDVQYRMKISHQRHLVTWAGSISVEMEFGSESRIMPHVVMVIPQQFSHGKLQLLLCFSALKNRDSLPACDQTITGLHRVYHYQCRHLSLFSPLRFPYSLLAFCRNFQFFGSSQKNSHKSAKVPCSGIVFNLEKKTGGENLSKTLHELHKPHNLII